MKPPPPEKVRIVQCLCGPARHCIIAVPYVPGVSAAQKDFGSPDDITLTRENAASYTEHLVDGMISRKLINPWCSLCNRPRSRWIFEDAQTKFNSFDEARELMNELEREQSVARIVLGPTKN